MWYLIYNVHVFMYTCVCMHGHTHTGFEFHPHLLGRLSSSSSKLNVVVLLNRLAGCSGTEPPCCVPTAATVCASPTPGSAHASPPIGTSAMAPRPSLCACRGRDGLERGDGSGSCSDACEYGSCREEPWGF